METTPPFHPCNGKTVFSTTHGAINFKSKNLCKITVICKYEKWKSLYKKAFLKIYACKFTYYWTSAQSLSRDQLFVTLNCSLLSVGFSQQEYWSRLSFPPPGDFLIQGSNSSLHYRWILYHWTTREAPPQLLLVKKQSVFFQ